jgi:hypothetical protein
VTSVTAPAVASDQFVEFAATRPARRPRAAWSARWLRRHGQRLRYGLVSATALGLLSAAAFEWHLWAGLVSAALSVLLVDFSVDGPRRRPS